MNMVKLDLAACADRAAAMQTLSEAMHFPEWFGMNLDALYDCLTDIGEDTVLCVFHAAQEGFEPFMQVLRDACEANSALCMVEGEEELPAACLGEAE